MTIENTFIVAAAGFGPAAVAVVGQRLGTGSVQAAKQHANVVLKLGLVTSIVLGILFAGVSLFVSMLYPKVGAEVLRFAIWGDPHCRLFSASQSFKRHFWKRSLGNRRRHEIRSDGSHRPLHIS